MGAGRRVKNVLIAIDQLLHVILTIGNADPDETISSALYRHDRNGHLVGRFLRPVVDLLFLPFEKDHCYKSFLSECHRAMNKRQSER